MRGEKEGRKKQARLNKQQGKVTQHTQGSHFSYENELPRVGLEPTLDRALYMYTCNTSTDRKDTCVIEQSQLGLFNNTGVLPRSGTQWYTVVHNGTQWYTVVVYNRFVVENCSGSEKGYRSPNQLSLTQGIQYYDQVMTPKEQSHQ